MKPTLRFLVLASLLATPLLAQAQNSYPLPCGTQQAVQELMKKNPDYARQMAEQINRMRSASANEALKGQQLTPKVIPIVVHIMHDYTGSNISREQVLDAVRMINEDFNRNNADTVNIIQPFKSLVADVQIEFRLARLDPNGNCTDGITRTYTPLTNSADDNVKDIIRWNPDKYLNIWVVRNISFGAGGYAYYPCAGPDIDGIVVRNAQFGSIGTSSTTSLPRSLTHEIGHYLDLPHTWGSTNDPGLASNCSTDDGVADTPNTVGVSGGGCNTNANTCGNLNNVQNVMDYASCQTMFTHGQKAAMQSAMVWATCRTNLWAQSNLSATGTSDGFSIAVCAPKADFAALRLRVCEGVAIQFKDMSYNAPVDSTWSWSWAFPGGTPSTSTDQDPLVQYNSSGLYPVTLTVSNSGGSNTFTRTNYIEVKAAISGLMAPLVESFESPSFPAAPVQPLQSWEIEQEGATTWERTTTASVTGASSMRIMLGDVNYDAVNSLISPNIDVSGISPKQVYFKMAYAPFTNQGAIADRLKVYYSVDCGQNWVLRYAKSGTALQTAPEVPGLFVPTANSWRQESIALPPNATTVMLKFEATSGAGNALYLDDINLNSSPVGLEENVPQQALWIFPNPSEGQAQIRYQLTGAGEAILSISNAIGQQVAINRQLKAEGIHELSLETLVGKLAPGLYFVRLQSGAGTSIQKLIIN